MTRSNARTLGPWYVAGFLNSYAATLLTSCCYWFAERELLASDSQRLWLSAAWGLAYIFIALLAGKLTTRLGARTMTIAMVAGTILTSSLGLLAIRFPSLATLALAMLAYNFTSSQIWPALESAIAQSPGTTPLSSRVAFYNLNWAAAGFLAFLTGGTIASLGWPAIFITPAIASILATTTLLLFAIPQRHLSAHHSRPRDDDDASHAPPSARNLLFMAWVGNALAYVAIQTLIPVIPTLTHRMSVTSIALGTALVALWPLSRFIGFIATWKWTRWHYSVAWLLTFQFLLAATFAALLLIPTLASTLGQTPTIALFIAAQVLFGIAAAFIYASSLYYAMHVSAGAGGHAGIHEALIGVGVAIGPAVGAVAGMASPSKASAIPIITLAVTTVLIAGALIMTHMGLRKTPPMKPRA